jgi:serine/threonine protein phosphatase PrpC
MTTPLPPPASPSSRFRIFSRTDVGKRRKRNEDSLGVIARHGIFVVADGMGGVDGGDYCSCLVVDRVALAFQNLAPADLCYREKLDLLERSIVESSALIKREAELRGISGMGTTVVAICFNTAGFREACILHVGDSRAYRWRARDLSPLTTDHSMAAESGLSDSALIPIFMAGVITRAVGVRADVLVDRTHVDVRAGDSFVLCSDGLYNMVPRTQMASILSRQPPDPAAELVACANEAGGFDNITVILVDVLPDPAATGNLRETQS